MPKSKQEIEIKLRVQDAAAMRVRLNHLNAQEIVPRTYESNTLYDTPGKDLTRRGQLIRIRSEQLVPKGNRSRINQNSVAILTYKGPAHRPVAGKGSRATRGHFKIREEAEVTLSESEQMTRILCALGLRPVFRYEKFRTTYALPGVLNLKVEFDETPVGLFLELEGNVSSIDNAARLLGYTQSDYMTQSYGALYFADCRRRGIKPANMLFSQTKQK